MTKRNIWAATEESEIYLGLTAIGLSKTEARCYSLLNIYWFSASELAKQLGVSRPNLYGSLKDLCSKGFVEQRRIVSPTKYKAVPLNTALVAYAEYQRNQVRDLIVTQEQNRDELIRLQETRARG
jgi:sugar-specific transcriptional regulator TrmB